MICVVMEATGVALLAFDRLLVESAYVLAQVLTLLSSIHFLHSTIPAAEEGIKN